MESIGHVGDQKKCYCCGGWFTLQGLPTDEASHMRREHLKNTIRSHPSGRVKVNGHVYTNSDKTNDVQDKSVSDDGIETNIEDSVISDGYRDLGEAKDDIHKKNAKKGQVNVEVEVNSNGEDNLKETTTTSHINQLSIVQKIEIFDHFQAKEGGYNTNATIRWVQKNE